MEQEKEIKDLEVVETPIDVPQETDESTRALGELSKKNPDEAAEIANSDTGAALTAELEKDLREI